MTTKVNNIEGTIKLSRAFKRTEIKAKKVQEVTIDLPSSSFEFFDWGSKK